MSEMNARNVGMLWKGKGKQEKGDRESHFSKFVFLDAAKVQFVVEMVSSALAFLQHLEAELSAALHYRAKHLIVRTPSEENFARPQLKKCAAHGPHINRIFERHAQY